MKHSFLSDGFFAAGFINPYEGLVVPDWAAYNLRTLGLSYFKLTTILQFLSL